MRFLPWHYGTRNLLRSPARLVQSAGGAMLVVLLVIAAAAFVRGMQESLAMPASSHNVLLLGAGSEESLERSELPGAVPGLVAAAVAGIRERLGVPYVSPEVHMGAMVRTETDGLERLATLRGVTPAAFLVHPQVRITSGTAPGIGEVLAGRLAAVKLGLDPGALVTGSRLWLGEREWVVSGTFEAPGTVMEAELWLDLYELKISARRETISAVFVTLDEAELADVMVFCKQRVDLELVAMSEGDYYGQLLAFYRPVTLMVWATALLIALGGFFGGLNTLYAAFAARIRELAALQALGFRRLALLVALLQESLLAATAGASVAALLGVLVLDGLAVRFSMGAFAMVVDAPVLASGLGAGLILGVAGVLPPAWRCLSPPIPEALKSL